MKRKTVILFFIFLAGVLISWILGPTSSRHNYIDGELRDPVASRGAAKPKGVVNIARSGAPSLSGKTSSQPGNDLPQSSWIMANHPELYKKIQDLDGSQVSFKNEWGELKSDLTAIDLDSRLTFAHMIFGKTQVQLDGRVQILKEIGLYLGLSDDNVRNLLIDREVRDILEGDDGDLLYAARHNSISLGELEDHISKRHGSFGAETREITLSLATNLAHVNPAMAERLVKTFAPGEEAAIRVEITERGFEGTSPQQLANWLVGLDMGDLDEQQQRRIEINLKKYGASFKNEFSEMYQEILLTSFKKETVDRFFESGQSEGE